MKITHISTLTKGGAGIAAFRLHQSLMRYENIQSNFVVRSRTDSNTADPDIHFAGNTGRSFFLKARIKSNLFVEHFHEKELLKRDRNYEAVSFATTSFRPEEMKVVQGADIIHLHWVSQFINYPTFFKRIKQPIVWTFHDMNPFMGLFHYEQDNISNPQLENVNNKVLKQKLDTLKNLSNIHIVCLSNWMKDKSEQSNLLGHFPHYLIPNALDFNQYPINNRDISKAELGLNKQIKTILFIAQDLKSHRKGGDLIIPTLKQIKTPFNLITIGGTKINEINNNVNHLHYNYIDKIDLLNTIYSATDLTVVPSREDNLPNTMLESFANGTPVLSFNNGGMAEHVKTGINGILEHNISSDSLANDIKDFLEGKYAFDSKQIRDYATTYFADSLQAARYIELYKNILGK